MESCISFSDPREGGVQRMVASQKLDQDSALNFFRNWLKLHKYVQYMFFLAQDKKSLEIRRTQNNRYIGIIELYQGKYYLEFYKKAGEWCTNQNSLIQFH